MHHIMWKQQKSHLFIVPYQILKSVFYILQLPGILKLKYVFCIKTYLNNPAYGRHSDSERDIRFRHHEGSLWTCYSLSLLRLQIVKKFTHGLIKVLSLFCFWLISKIWFYIYFLKNVNKIKYQKAILNSGSLHVTANAFINKISFFNLLLHDFIYCFTTWN